MLMTTKPGRVVTYHAGHPPIKSHDPLIMRSFVIMSQPKLSLHNHSAYSHQTWQDGDLHWGTPACKVTWYFDHAVLQNHTTNKKHHHHIAYGHLTWQCGD